MLLFLRVLALIVLAAVVNGKDHMFNQLSTCISVTELKERMPQWVDTVPYSHLTNKTWGFPTDCSGFVSWALDSDRDIKAYEFASNEFSNIVAIDDLRYGDIITHVFDKTDLGRCDTKSLTANSLLKIGHVSGHVFFFDRWDDDNHTAFWAYESSSTQDQTDACLAQKGPLTWSQCVNHHVLKSRDIPEKWSKDNCTDTTYGWVSGGPRRLSPEHLCSDTEPLVLL